MLTVIIISEIGKIILKMEMVCLHGHVAVNTMANGKRTSKLVGACFNMLIKINTKVNGKIIVKMDMACLHGHVVVSIQVIGKMTKSMALENLSGPVAVVIWDSGKMI